MTRRLCLLAIALIIAIASGTAWSQQPNRIPVVGVLTAHCRPG